MLGLFLLFAAPARAEPDDCLKQVEPTPDHALAQAGARLKANPRDAAALLCAATAEFNIGAYHEAATYFLQLAAQQAQPAEAARAYGKAGWAAMRANDLKSAGAAFARVIKLTPKDPVAWQDHATVLMQSEQFWEAKRELDYALRLAPNDANALALRADCWLKLNIPAQAKKDARQALSLQPEQELAHGVLQKIAAME